MAFRNPLDEAETDIPLSNLFSQSPPRYSEGCESYIVEGSRKKKLTTVEDASDSPNLSLSPVSPVSPHPHALDRPAPLPQSTCSSAITATSRARFSPAPKFSSLRGLRQQKLTLFCHAILPAPSQSKPPPFFLLHGPPGTGKTSLARCLAGEKCWGLTEVEVERARSKVRASKDASSDLLSSNI